MKKRMLSLCLALVMVLGLLPMRAWAEETSVADYFAGMPVTADPGKGTTAWKVQDNSLVSGNKGKGNSSSILTLSFTADTAISFEYKVSSEAKYDKCTITLGTTTIADAISGEGEWTAFVGEVKKGSVLQVTYKKDSSGNKNEDCVYLRNFTCGTPLTVTFHDGSESAVQNIYGGSGTLKANTFTQAGKVFAGWAEDNGNEVKYTNGAAITLTEDIDLYAVWADAYTVTFDNNGVQTKKDVAQNYAIGASNIPSDPIRIGYAFGGWYNGGTALYAETVITANVTYTAKWTPITYTIHFDANGGEGVVTDLTATYDEDIVLPECAFTRSGYTFVGWGKGRSSKSYAVGEAVKNLQSKQDATQTLYAIWQGNPVNITVNYNDGVTESSSRIGVVGENYNYIRNENTGAASYSTLADPIRSGNLFKGWFDSAEGGNKITNQYKFTAEDAENGIMFYAHWAEAVTITLDANGGTVGYSSASTQTKQIDKGTAYGTLPSPSYSGKKFVGWYTAQEGGEQADASTVFTKDTTLYAHWRSYQITVNFNANGGDGSMDALVFDSGATVKLPANQFTHDGYKFTKWSASQYSNYTTYEDEADYTVSSSNSDSTKTLYAVWEQTTFGKANEAIKAKLPNDNTVTATGSLSLPTTGTGYIVTYTSSNAAYMESDTVTALPQRGTEQIMLSAVITDTSDSSTESRTYTLTLYSTEASAAKTELTKAANALTGTFTPVYGTDTNADTAIEKILVDKGYYGITVSVKEAVSDTNGYASIDADGTTHYYFNPNMTGSGAYFYTDFCLSKNGAMVEKHWYTNIGWDKAKVRSALETELDRIVLPTEPVVELRLPQCSPKEGSNPAVDGYSYNTQNTWAKLTWTSSDESIVKVGTAPSYPTYSPYSTALTRSTAIDSTATLTAHIVCNSVSDVSAEKQFAVTVQRIDSEEQDAVKNALTAALEKGFDVKGLRDYVTGDEITVDSDGIYSVSNDLQFPITRDFGIDGKYYPVTITSSNSDVIEIPKGNNVARASVYRPLPGKSAEQVTLTIRITEKASGIYAEKQLTVSVQPLTQAEIDDEIALMELVKAHYFDGIKNANAEASNITTNLHAFQEVYQGKNGLVWVYDNENCVRYGIVPAAMEGWYDLQVWRCFRSSNDAVITHENLLVTRQAESKAATITSYLSSETFGKYAEKYPDHADFQKLYYQPVSIDLIVAGTAPTVQTPTEDKLSVSFTLQSASGTLIAKTQVSDLTEGSTAFDAFRKVLAANGCTYAARGSYVYSITPNGGSKIGEFDLGANSGWLYKVNGTIPSSYMAAYTLHDGDNIVMFFTRDYTQENWTAAASTTAKANAAISPQVTAVNGIATAKLDGNSISAAVAHAEESGMDIVVIAPEVKGNADSVKIELPKVSISDIASGTNAALAIKTDLGKVSISNDALAAIAAQASGKNISVSVEKAEVKDIASAALAEVSAAVDAKALADAAIVKIDITSGGRNVTAFGGAALTLELPVSKAHEEGKAYLVLAVSDNGTVSRMTGRMADGKLVVTTTHLTTFIATASEVKTFSDVVENAYYYDAVLWAVTSGVTSGTSEVSFSPNASCTRAQAVTFLWRAAGSPVVNYTMPFTDVSADAYYAEAVCWAVSEGITGGTSATTFSPDATCSRAQIVSFLYRMNKVDTLNIKDNPFSDVAEGSYYYDAVLWAAEQGTTEGTSVTTFSPDNICTRGQIVTLLYRFFVK